MNNRSNEDRSFSSNGMPTRSPSSTVGDNDEGNNKASEITKAT